MTELEGLITDAVTLRPRGAQEIVSLIVEKAGDRYLSVKIKATALAMVTDGRLKMNNMWEITR